MNSAGRTTLSLGILLASFGLAFAPLGGPVNLVVVSGSELQEPLEKLVEAYERQNSGVSIELKIQGSQDMMNKFVDQTNSFDPAVIIPANGELLKNLEQRLQSQGEPQPFAIQPQPIAKTLLVAIAWPERAKTLFPSGNFRWSELEKALQQKTWGAIGGQSQWGSFDFLMTNPTRSNSGQLTLALWSKAKTGQSTTGAALQQTTEVDSLFKLLKKSVYQPPRSTDILLQEFISRGPNDADMATVYESVALHRWESAKASKGKPYQIFYPETTMETVATGTVVQRNTSSAQRQESKDFLAFLREEPQQEVFAQHGFRPIKAESNLSSITASPWGKGIPGVQMTPSSKVATVPQETVVTELVKQWQRSH